MSQERIDTVLLRKQTEREGRKDLQTPGLLSDDRATEWASSMGPARSSQVSAKVGSRQG